MAKNKKYEVTITRSEWHTITVEAKNEEQADSKAWQILTELGPGMFDITGSEWEEDSHVEEIEEDED